MLIKKRKDLKNEDEIHKNELAIKNIDKLKAKIEKRIEENNEKGNLNN